VGAFPAFRNQTSTKNASPGGESSGSSIHLNLDVVTKNLLSWIPLKGVLGFPPSNQNEDNGPKGVLAVRNYVQNRMFSVFVMVLNGGKHLILFICSYYSYFLPIYYV
jgi:hypothetical protein